MNSNQNTATSAIDITAVGSLTHAETAQVAGGALSLSMAVRGYCPCTSGNPISFANFASQVVNPAINVASFAALSF